MEALAKLAQAISSSRDPCAIVSKWMEYADLARKSVVSLATSFVRNKVVTTISHSSAVREALLSARPRKVIVLESRPGIEALDLLSLLERSGIDVEPLPDSCIARAVSESDVVVIGADAVDIDGNVLNKVGSRTLAIAARYAGIPLVVVCEALKISRTPCRDLEARVEWLYDIGGKSVRVRVFECVERELVTYLVTDLGLAKPCREILERMLEEVYERLGCA